MCAIILQMIHVWVVGGGIHWSNLIADWFMCVIFPVSFLIADSGVVILIVFSLLPQMSA